MEIYLSINNREKVIKLPYLPSELNVTSTQSNDTYTAINGEINLIGNMQLKALSFSSFLDSWDILNDIETMRLRKIPFRLIITDTPINMAVTVDSLEYSMKKGKKIYYSITFKEFRFLEVK